MAIGEHIRNRELFQPRCPGSLDDPHKGNVMGSQLVKLDL